MALTRYGGSLRVVVMVVLEVGRWLKDTDPGSNFVFLIASFGRMALRRPFRLVGTIRGLDQHFEHLLAVAAPHRDIAVSDVGKCGLPTIRVRAAKQSPALRIIRFHFANLRTFAWSDLRSSLATCYRTLGVAEYGSCIARPFSHELARTVFVRARASECESYLGRTFREGEDAGLTATLGGVLLKQS